MKRTGNFYSVNSTFINAALLATHANHHEVGFRQKHLKFYIELLTNWMRTSFKGSGLLINNNQVKRLLEELIDSGLLKKTKKNDQPLYRFHPYGLLEITNRMIDLEKIDKIQDFFFLYHFIHLYASKLKSVISNDSKGLPPEFELEISYLLKTESLVHKQKERINLMTKKLKLRIQEAHDMADFAKSLVAQGVHINSIVQEVEGRFPYQLNHQKKMTDLFKELPLDIQLIEIMEAPKMRAQTLWSPLLQYYEDFLKQLDSLPK